MVPKCINSLASSIGSLLTTILSSFLVNSVLNVLHFFPFHFSPTLDASSIFLLVFSLKSWNLDDNNTISSAKSTSSSVVVNSNLHVIPLLSPVVVFFTTQPIARRKRNPDINTPVLCQSLSGTTLMFLFLYDSTIKLLVVCNFDVFSMSFEIVILWVYYTIPLASACLGTFWSLLFNVLYYMFG